MIYRISTGLAILLGLAALVNGIYMVIAPESWFGSVPGVLDRGLFNQHLVRDIGFIYLLIAVAFILGTVNHKHRLEFWLMPTAWLVCHAMFHIWEVIMGFSGSDSLIEDFTGVTLPALLSLGLIYGSFGTVDNE